MKKPNFKECIADVFNCSVDTINSNLNGIITIAEACKAHHKYKVEMHKYWKKFKQQEKHNKVKTSVSEIL